MKTLHLSIYQAARRAAFALLAAATAASLAVPFAAADEVVNLYTDRQTKLLQPLLDAFTEQSGIAVNALFAKKGLRERMVAEGAQSLADVVLVVDAGRLDEFAQSGLLASYNDSRLTEGLTPDLYTRDWFAVTRRARILYVPKGNSPLGYADLADSSKTGKGICIRTGFHPYNIGLFSEYISKHGEDATRDWLRGVKANLARTPQGNDRAQIQGVMDGVCSVAVANSYYYFVMLNNPDKRADLLAKVDVVIPSPAHINITGAGLAAHAPNHANALAFLRYLATPAAQELLAQQNGEYPARHDVPLPDFLKDVAVDGTLEDLFTHRTRASELVEEVGFDL